MKRARRRKGGFSLLELLITAAVIYVLAAVAIPKFIQMFGLGNP